MHMARRLLSKPIHAKEEKNLMATAMLPQPSLPLSAGTEPKSQGRCWNKWKVV